ncbi:MAG: ATP synthase F0 subunit B [Desulfobacterales bacterium]|nr:ATP synthase F0 subunit B [Desulfobacterales bacterium]
MIQIDVSLFIQIVNFLLLIWVLNKVLYKPIRVKLSERKKTVVDGQQWIDDIKNQAQGIELQINDSLKRARAEGLKSKETFIQEAMLNEKKMLEEMNQKVRSELENSRKKMDGEIQKTREFLVNEIDIYAEAIGRKILGRAIQ